MSIPANAIEQLESWFGRAMLAGLELPGGWLGRPHDNLHQLTWSATLSHKVLFELDHQILVVLTDPGRLEITPAEFRFIECVQVTIDWQEYGNMRAHSENRGRGTVILHAQ